MENTNYINLGIEYNVHESICGVWCRRFILRSRLLELWTQFVSLF